MRKPRPDASVADAVSFLLSRITEQARKSSVPLTDVELKQLSFSEETASAEEIAEVKEFDATTDSDEFEEKIAKLLRRAFDHDAKNGTGDVWQKHLAALRDHDIYVLVMVDQAGISRPKAKVPVPSFFRISLGQVIRIVPDALAGLITLCGFVYFFVLQMGWGRRGASNFRKSVQEDYSQRQHPRCFPVDLDR